MFKGKLISNVGFTLERANEAIAAGTSDMISFGKAFIANPDLVDRLKSSAPLNVADGDTFYAGDDKGYIDYPTLAESSVSAS